MTFKALDVLETFNAYKRFLLDYPFISNKSNMLSITDLKHRWTATWNPNMYHGWGKERNYFEGWYFKIVDLTEQYVFALIPGISKGADGHQHAFIQVLDGIKCQATYHEFAATDFQAATDKFAVQLGGNYFSAEYIILDLPELKGRVNIKNIYPWPKMLGAPGIMGWYSFMPFMQCYHGVVSMHHHLEGQLQVYGQTVDFTAGKSYIEKDWGRSFPSAWIWTQTNHFESDRRVSLMASVANIPWLGTHFVGYLVGFLLDDKLYRFATYTGAMMQARLADKQVLLSFKDGQHRIVIKAHQAEGSDLWSPISGDMTGKVNESMQAKLEVELYHKDELIYSGTGRNAGLEVAGDVATLLTDKWRR